MAGVVSGGDLRRFEPRLTRAMAPPSGRGPGPVRGVDWPGLAVRHRSGGGPWLDALAANPDTGLLMAWDGHLLNQEFQAPGQSGPDPVRALHGFASHGLDVIPRLEGGVAAVLCDLRAGRLHLSRDRYGRRPLFYAPLDGGVAFASEPGALLELLDTRPGVDPAALFGYLERLESDAPRSLFATVRQVPAGHMVTVDLATGRTAEPVRWFTPTLPPEESGDRARMAVAVRAVLVDSIQRQTRDTPIVGVSLSGGIDSRLMLAALVSLRRGGESVRALTFVPNRPGVANESDIAREFAMRHGVRWAGVTVDVASIPAELRRQVRAQGEPFQSPVVLAQAAIARTLEAGGGSLILEGHGADELFAGSPGHRVAAALSDWYAGRHVECLARLSRCTARDQAAAARAVMTRRVSPWWRDRQRPVAESRGRDGWLRGDWFAAMHLQAPSAPARQEPDRALHRALIAAQFGLRLQSLLRFADRSASASGVKSCTPFLDESLSRLALSLPPAQLVGRDGTLKLILREALGDPLPPDRRARRAKIGFALPVVYWLAEHRAWVAERLHHAAGLPFIRRDAVERRWQLVLDRADEASAYAVWRLVVLAEWLDEFGVSVPA